MVGRYEDRLGEPRVWPVLIDSQDVEFDDAGRPLLVLQERARGEVWVLHYLDPDDGTELGVHVTSKPYDDLDGALAEARLWLETQRRR